MKIMRVEDNAVNQKVGRQFVRSLGYGVEVARDGLEALRKCEAQTFDLVLTDCQIPGMDGYEATRELRRREADSGKHIPILAMTANALPGDREACIAAGMDDYVAKPMRIEELGRAIEKWLTRAVETTRD